MYYGKNWMPAVCAVEIGEQNGPDRRVIGTHLVVGIAAAIERFPTWPVVQFRRFGRCHRRRLAVGTDRRRLAPIEGSLNDASRAKSYELLGIQAKLRYPASPPIVPPGNPHSPVIRRSRFLNAGPSSVLSPLCPSATFRQQRKLHPSNRLNR